MDFNDDICLALHGHVQSEKLEYYCVFVFPGFCVLVGTYVRLQNTETLKY